MNEFLINELFNRAGIDKAIHEITMISDERSKQAYERLEIPKIYHPFITGPHNENIRLFTEGSGVKVNIPPLSVMKDEISIAGEKDGVLKVKNAINQVRKKNPSVCLLSHCLIVPQWFDNVCASIKTRLITTTLFLILFELPFIYLFVLFCFTDL